MVELDVGLRRLQQMGCDLLRLVAQLARDHRRGCPAHGSAATGVGAQPVGGVVGVALLDLDVGGGDAEFLGHDLREGCLVPLALALDAKLEDRLARGVHAQFRGVEHPEPGDVVVLAGARADDFGEAGDPDSHQLTLLPLLGLLFPQLLVAELVERELHGLGVVATVVLEAGGRHVGELLGLDEVLEPDVRRIQVHFQRGTLNQALD